MVAVTLSTHRAGAIAAAGYVFLFPLVANYRRLYAEAIDPSSPSFLGGFGRWAHHSVPAQDTAQDTTMVSSAWLDVRAEPWLCWTPPDNHERVTTFTDLWGFMVVEGAEVAESEPEQVGPVIVSTDAWVGAVPADVARLERMESPFVRCETSIQIPQELELDRRQAIERGFRLEPLSTWRQSGLVPQAPPISWLPVDEDSLATLEFWPTAAFALTLVSPHDHDRGILDRLAEIGVIPGARWDADALDSDVVEAIGEGMDSALSELMRAAASRDGSAMLSGLRPDADRDYFSRALAAVGTISPVDQR